MTKLALIHISLLPLKVHISELLCKRWRELLIVMSTQRITIRLQLPPALYCFGSTSRLSHRQATVFKEKSLYATCPEPIGKDSN